MVGIGIVVVAVFIVFIAFACVVFSGNMDIRDE